MKEVTESQIRQEVLMEKLANFEANTKTSFDRIHARVDKLEEAMLVKEKSVRDHIEKLEPMAANGDSVHKGMLFTAKALGTMVVAMFFALTVWAIKVSQYTPQG